MSRSTFGRYRVLSGSMMIPCFLIGGILVFTFCRNVILPSTFRPEHPLIPTDVWGFYMMGFAGALLMTWGGFLALAVQHPELSRGIGTATAAGLLLNAAVRALVWFSGQYAPLGILPGAEAVVMLALAVGFLVLRPPRAQAGVPPPAVARIQGTPLPRPQ